MMPYDLILLICLLALVWALIRVIRAVNALAEAVRGHTWLLRAIEQAWRRGEEETHHEA